MILVNKLVFLEDLTAIWLFYVGLQAHHSAFFALCEEIVQHLERVQVTVLVVFPGAKDSKYAFDDFDDDRKRVADQ